MLPAVHDIDPQRFLDNEMTHRIRQSRMRGLVGTFEHESSLGEDPSVEQSLRTWLASYDYNFQACFAPWIGGSQYKMNRNRRGELFFFYHQQLAARMFLETGQDQIEQCSRHAMPCIRGNSFKAQEIEDFERRIRDAIDQGFILLPNGEQQSLEPWRSIEQLGNLIQGNLDSLNPGFYGTLGVNARKLLEEPATTFMPYPRQFESPLSNPSRLK